MDKDVYDIEKLPYNWKKIAQHIGIDNLIRLTEAMGGEYLFIPKKENLLKCFRPDSIRKDRDDGLTYEEIAKKHGISVDTVRRALRE